MENDKIDLRVESKSSKEKVDRAHGGIKDEYIAVLKSNPERTPVYVLKVISPERLDLDEYRLRTGFQIILHSTNRTLKDWESKEPDKPLEEMGEKERDACLENDPSIYPFKDRSSTKTKT